jgi:hypothetical protein
MPADPNPNVDPLSPTSNCCLCAATSGVGDVTGSDCSCDPMPGRIFVAITVSACPGVTLTGHMDYDSGNRRWQGLIEDGAGGHLLLALLCPERLCFGNVITGPFAVACGGASVTCGGDSYFLQGPYSFPSSFTCSPFSIVWTILVRTGPPPVFVTVTLSP